MELIQLDVSENLLPTLAANVKPISAPFALEFDASGNLPELAVASHEAQLTH